MDIGDLLKKARETKGLSLREVSEKSGLSASFIGQVERNETSPSMRSLRSLTDALGVRLTELVNCLEESKDTSPHTTLERRRQIENIFKGVDVYVLSPEGDRALQTSIMYIRPGASSGENDFSHIGEEVGYIQMGALDFWLDGAEYHLREGDSISFKSNVPHRWENRSVSPCIALWVVTPPNL